MEISFDKAVASRQLAKELEQRFGVREPEVVRTSSGEILPMPAPEIVVVREGSDGPYTISGLPDEVTEGQVLAAVSDHVPNVATPVDPQAERIAQLEARLAELERRLSAQ